MSSLWPLARVRVVNGIEEHMSDAELSLEGWSACRCGFTEQAYLNYSMYVIMDRAPPYQRRFETGAADASSMP